MDVAERVPRFSLNKFRLRKVAQKIADINSMLLDQLERSVSPEDLDRFVLALTATIQELASRSEKTEFSRNYDRCISCKATRAKSQELKYFRFSKRRRKWTYYILLHRTRMLLAELMFAMCGNANYEPDDDIILESTQIIPQTDEDCLDLVFDEPS
ncbi:hypothetical protein AVEN_273892-1 [Araneus ventricosus]|uniref:Uncharacterized protein n=1 Tax=Araneus ventricosus TaxID=182803 RepID=A0A4Y2ISR4_ARAVE|nr:hypothetical protein AVEN_273892-1 [Araneus ventricosus]